MTTLIVYRSSLIVWALSLIVCHLSFSQLPDSLWMATFSPGPNDYARDVEITMYGNYLLAGYTTDPARGDSGTGWVMKVNDRGDLLWYREYPQFARINALHALEYGGFAVCGRTEDYQGMVASGLDTGELYWSQARGAQAEFTHLCLMDDWSIACCGYRWIDFGSRQDAYVAKYRMNGEFLWEWASNATGWDNAEQIAVTASNQLLVAGTTVRTPNAARLTRLTENGEVLWTEEFLPEPDTYIRGTHVFYDGSGGCHLATTRERGDGTMGFHVTRLSANRVPIWNFSNFVFGLRVDLRDMTDYYSGVFDEKFLYSGILEDSIRSVFLEKRDGASEPDWLLRLSIPGAEPAAAAALDDSQFVVAGSLCHPGQESDVFLLRVGSPTLDLVIRRLLWPSPSMRLLWKAISGAVVYNIYRGSETSFLQLIGTANTTQFDDIGVLDLPASQHFYVVTASDEAGQTIARTSGNGSGQDGE